MGKWLNWIFVALVIFGAYRWFSRQNPQTETPDDTESVAEETLAPTPAPQALQTPQAPTQAQPPAPAPAPKVVEAPPPPAPGKFQKLPPNAVPFRLVNGLFVSYGDLVLGKPTVENVPNEGFAESPKPLKWGRNVIPFFVAPDIPSPDRIYRALKYMNENTTIEFVPVTDQRDAIVFEKTDEHCYSYLGRIGGHQPVYISNDCQESEITHELLHVLGFVHEQSRPDRDEYVAIYVDRIQNDKVDQFQIVPDSLVAPIKSRPFDFHSIMLYRPTAFAKQSGDVTMESIVPGQSVDPVKTGLSEEDIKRIELLYPSE